MEGFNRSPSDVTGARLLKNGLAPLIKQAFEDGRGGERWVGDMLDLLLARKMSFTYHDYHEDHFGLYLGEGKLPTDKQLNKPLYEVLKKKLKP